jgi:2-methylfumaryl-CoA isomerase
MVSSARPLAGLRVIEISSFVAAPLGGMTLAQLGADVIRVDPLGGAADQRRWPLSPSGISLYWAGLNKGKRSITVDFAGAAGREIVTDLVRACPPGTGVVLTNAVGRDWLSASALTAMSPDLIHVQIEGRSDGTPAVDYTVNAEVGFPMVTGPAGFADPVNHVLPAWDIACGLYAALGVSAAARRRERTGEGAVIRIALADVALAMAGNLGFLAEAQVNNVPRPRIGNYLYGGFARDFACADGERVMVVALTPRHWRDLVRVTEMPEPVAALERSLGVDFADEGDRFEYREVLAGLFRRWFAGLPLDEVTAALARTPLVWAPYRTFGQAVQHLQTPAGANPIATQVTQPDVGTYLVPGSPLRFGTAVTEARPAPTLGEHTASVLADELGYDGARIDALLHTD